MAARPDMPLRRRVQAEPAPSRPRPPEAVFRAARAIAQAIVAREVRSRLGKA